MLEIGGILGVFDDCQGERQSRRSLAKNEFQMFSWAKVAYEVEVEATSCESDVGTWGIGVEYHSGSATSGEA